MIEQFSFDIQLIFAILNGKVSAAINRKLSRNFRQNGMEITPEQWTVLLFLWEKDGVTQQELCNATFKDKPSMTRLIDNMERQHLVVRISDKKGTGRESTLHSQQNTQGSPSRINTGRAESQPGGTSQNLHEYEKLSRLPKGKKDIDICHKLPYNY